MLSYAIHSPMQLPCSTWNLHPPHKHTPIITSTHHNTPALITLPLRLTQSPTPCRTSNTTIKHGPDVSVVLRDELPLTCVPCFELCVGRGGREEVAVWCRVRGDGGDDVLQKAMSVWSLEERKRETHVVRYFTPRGTRPDIPNDRLPIRRATGQQ